MITNMDRIMMTMTVTKPAGSVVLHVTGLPATAGPAASRPGAVMSPGGPP